MKQRAAYRWIFIFFSQGIGFLGLASCTRSASAVPARDGPVTQAELFAATRPGYKGAALGALFKKGVTPGMNLAQGGAYKATRSNTEGGNESN